jgi:hypothetical protein
MAKLTEHEEREPRIDALVEELRTVDVRKIIGGLRELMRQDGLSG